MVLLHASCHNPTGADLSQDEWRAVLELVKRRRLLPFIDMAYQGLGDGPDEDAFAIRLFCAELPEVVCAVSCSKNFGLYRERTGSLHIVSESAGECRGDPEPAGAPGARHVVDAAGPRRGDRAPHPVEPGARQQWSAELEAMRQRILGLRHQVVQQLRAHCPQRDFSFIATQRGMFSTSASAPSRCVRCARSTTST